MDKLSWQALEYEERERGADWFWALGVIVATSTVASLIYHNYFFAGLVILGGGMLWFFAIRKPQLVSYELNSLGFRIGDRLYPYKNIASFWVQKPHNDKDAEHLRPMLFIKSERFFMPIITAPLPDDLVNIVHDTLLGEDIVEEEMRQHASEKIMDYLGF